MKPAVSVSKTSNLAKLKVELRKLSQTDVLVGWPGDSTAFRKELSGDITNPELAYLMTEGSPLQGIPARPILQPAITLPANKALIADQLAVAAQAVLEGKPEQAQQELEKAGVLATNLVKRFFTDSANGWAPNSPLTIARKGSDKPLIDTGQLRRSVSYIVRTK